MSSSNPLALPRDRAAATLPERAKKYVQRARAKNTKTAYERCWNDFCFHCATVAQVPALPASPETISDYISRMADDGKRVSTIDQRLAAIAFFHKDNGLDDPTAHPFVRVTMSGIRREHGTAPEQKAPITRDDLRHLTLILGDDLRGVRDAAILLVGFAGAFRESELAALDVADLKFTDADVLIRVRRSKTDQEGEGRFKRLPLLSESNALSCPVRALRAYLTAAEITSGPVFRKIDRWGKVGRRRLLPAAVAFIVKRTVARAGFDPHEFAGHSLRAGFVTQAAEDGIPLHEIQDVTWHKSSDMVHRYIRNQGISAQRTIRTVLGE